MSELGNRARKIRYRFKHEWLAPENLVLAGAAVVCLVCTWGAINSMTRNWELAQDLMNRQREKALLELEVETLELENAYYLSEEYQELAARKYQGKMLPGETMVYLPENSEKAKTKHLDTDYQSSEDSFTNMSNFEQWMKFLFGF